MRNSPLPFVLTCVGVFFCGAVFSAAEWKDDYALLTKGVDALELGGGSVAGGVAILGRSAFPVAQSNERQVVVGAGCYGDVPTGARVVALAHTGLANPAKPEMQRWLQNVLGWVGRVEQPSLLVVGGGANPWNASGVRAVEAPKAWNAGALASVKCVFVNLHGVPVEQLAVLEQDLAKFQKIGGGIVFAATPWAAKKEALEFASRLMEPAGLSFLPGSGPSDSRYPLGSVPSPYSSALRAMDALNAEKSAKGTPLSMADRQVACSAVDGCLAAGLVPAALEKSLLALHVQTGWSQFTAAQPLRKNLKPVEALMARFESWWLAHQPPEKTPAHPLAADYPGLPAEGVPQRKAISFNALTGPDQLVNHGERTRIATGLYARPGSVVRVGIPQGAVNGGLKLEIGIHTDKNWNLAAWRRFPEISTLTELRRPETMAANSFGGLISIIVPAGCQLGEMQVVIDGALEAPVYRLGKTTDALWKQARQAPGAWGFLETPLWTGYFSRAQILAMENPEAVAGYWHSVVSVADRFLGYGPWRKRGESMLVDRDITVGYGHAGYPVMMAYGAEKQENADALFGRAPKSGDWGFLHELGHTFQDSFDGNYTIATHGEVDVNLVPGLVIQKVHGRTCWDNDAHSTFNAKTRISDWEAWGRLPAEEQTWAKACKMNVAYDFYFTLAECFGWELYERAFGRWMNWLQKPGKDASLDAISAKDPNAKRDRFFTLFCEESKCNLLPFFEKYGLGKGEFEISDAVKKKVANLPVWTGNRPVESLEGPKEVRLPAGGALPKVLGQFVAKDPDPGTVFSYRIAEGNEEGCFAIDRRTGQLSVLKAPPRAASVLTIEVQDNCIPLSTARAQCVVGR